MISDLNFLEISRGNISVGVYQLISSLLEVDFEPQAARSVAEAKAITPTATILLKLRFLIIIIRGLLQSKIYFRVYLYLKIV